MQKLKLVQSLNKAVNERRICGIVHRKSPVWKDRNRNLTRRYSTVANAFTRMTTFMLTDGYVSDVCEIVHNSSGMQLGTIKVTATGHIKIQFNLKGE